jgi:hypothetical protein
MGTAASRSPWTTNSTFTSRNWRWLFSADVLIAVRWTVYVSLECICLVFRWKIVCEVCGCEIQGHVVERNDTPVLGKCGTV